MAIGSEKFRRLPTTKPAPENLRRLLEALEEVGLERRPGRHRTGGPDAIVSQQRSRRTLPQAEPDGRRQQRCDDRDAAGAPDRAGRRPAAQRARQPLPDRSRGQRGVRLRALQRLPLHAGLRRRRQEAVAGRQPVRPGASRHDPPRHAGGAGRRWRRRSGHRPLLGRGRQEGADGAAWHRRHGAAPGNARQRLAERRVPDRGIAGTRPQHALDPGVGAQPERLCCRGQLHRHLGADAGVRRQPEPGLGPQHLCRRALCLPGRRQRGRRRRTIFIGKYLYEPDGTRVCTVEHRQHARRRGGGGRPRSKPAGDGGGA